MRKIIGKILKYLLIMVGGLIGLVLLVLVALYIPPVQKFIFEKVVETINKSESLQIDYKSLQLKFPTHVVGEDLNVKLPNDMEAKVSYADLPVKLSSLIKGEIASEDLEVLGAHFRIGTPDSMFYLNANIDTLNLDNFSMGILSAKINIGKGDVNNVDVMLFINGESKVQQDTTEKTSGKPFEINADLLEMTHVNYLMSIYETIDTLSAEIDDVVLKKANVDLDKQSIKATDFNVEGVIARYIYFPPKETTEKNGKVETSPIEQMTDSLLWKINIDEVSLTCKSAIYAMMGAIPKPGFDLNYIRASEIVIEIDSFYNCGSDIRVPIKKLSAFESCGISLDAEGVFSMEKGLMRADDFKIFLPGSSIYLDAEMGLVSKTYPEIAECPVFMDLNANISTRDIVMGMPSLKPMIENFPPATPLEVTALLKGTMDRIDFEKFKISLPRMLNMSATGYAGGFLSGKPEDLIANLHFNGAIQNSQVLKPSVVEAKLGKGIKIEPFKINGNVNYYRGIGKGNVKITARNGDIALDGNLNLRKEEYDIEFNINKFPIQAFVPGFGVSDVSMTANATGRGFDMFRKSTSLEANLSIDEIHYHDATFDNLRLKATLDNGIAMVRLISGMDAANVKLTLSGNLTGSEYDWVVNGNLDNINLYDLGLSSYDSGGTIIFNGEARMNLDSMLIDAYIDFPVIDWTEDLTNFRTTNLLMKFEANKTNTSFSLIDHGLKFEVQSPSPLDSIIKMLQDLTCAIDSCMKNMYLNVPLIQSSMPKFDASLTVGGRNILSNMMLDHGERFDSIHVFINNDSSFRMNGMLEFYRSLKSRADTLGIDIAQKADSLALNAYIFNGPNSPGDWADVKLWGQLGGNEVKLRFVQNNTVHKTGFDIGFIAQYADSTIKVHFIPENPIIGYTDWTLNQNNFVSLNMADRHLDADLYLKNPKSSLRLYTDHIKGTVEQEEINLALTDIEISDWIQLNPFATPMKGNLTGTVSLSQNGKIISGKGNVELADFIYGKKRVGTFDLDLSVSTTPGGFVHAQAALDIDSLHVLTVKGVVNDTTVVNPFQLDLNINQFPLKVVNPFLTDAGIELYGILDGKMEVTGTPSVPVFNGFVDFEDAGVKVELLGTTFKLSNEKIPIDTGVVYFKEYNILAVNENPFVLNGTVNMHEVFNPHVDLTIDAKDIQLVGSDRARGGAEVYGKAFIDLNASAKGDMNFMRVNADATILRNTNVTYVMVSGGKNTLQSRSNSNLVKFVNFADTLSVEAADSIKLTGTIMNVNANLHIQDGSTINVDLSADGKNKISVEPSGDLDFSLDALGQQHLTGRVNINGGFARYTPPFMTEKLFNFQEGSYVAFNGDILNPILNIHAVDHLRANVTQEGQNSRLIYFDIELDVTGSLNNMNVAFNLSTDDDITVENELASMSPSQRASSAMNLLLTNIYSGPGTKGDANLGANALYAFLGSQLNSWAANNIKGVDLTFGVNQYENTVDGMTSQATSYSYRVSKSLFNDRFKIIIGGSYTTDADVDESFSQDLINDISFEYMLNKSGSMYIRLFRHTGYESILEGEITQTGVGFTYKKRMDSLKHMFHFLFPHWHDDN